MLPTWQPSWIKKKKNLFYQSPAESIFHQAWLLISICQNQMNSAMNLPPTFKIRSNLKSWLAEISEWWSFKFLQKRKIFTRSAAKCHRSVSRVNAKIHARLAPVMTDITIWCWWKPRLKLLSNRWELLKSRTRSGKKDGMHSALELRTHWRTLLATEFSTITSCLPPTKTSSSDTKMPTWLTISKITNNNQSWWSKECEPSWSSCTFKQVGQDSLQDSKADLPLTTWNQLDNSWTRIWHQNNPTQSNLAPRKRRQPSWIRMSSEVFRLATFHLRCC